MVLLLGDEKMDNWRCEAKARGGCSTVAGDGCSLGSGFNAKCQEKPLEAGWCCYTVFV